jgi:hypothetical protein
LAAVTTALAVPQIDLLVRVGCSLVYEAATPASLLLNLRPRTDPRQALHQEMLGFGAGGRDGPRDDMITTEVAPTCNPARAVAAPSEPVMVNDDPATLFVRDVPDSTAHGGSRR